MIWLFRTDPEKSGRRYLDRYLKEKEKLDCELRENLVIGSGVRTQKNMEALYYRTRNRIEDKCGSSSLLLKELKENAPYWISPKQD